MKKLFKILLFSVFILLIQSSVFAQDSEAAKQINKTSEQSDNLYGKKIQQQTLSANTFEKLDTVAPNKSKKKTCIKHKRRHQ